MDGLREAGLDDLVVIATTLGRGRPATPLAVPFVLGLNGNAVTFSTALAAATRLGDGIASPLQLQASSGRAVLGGGEGYLAQLASFPSI